MSRSILKTALLPVLWLLPFAHCVAAGASHECAAIAEPGARLACYDAAFPPVDGAAVAAAAADPEQQRRDFGLSVQQKRERTPALLRPPEGPDRVEARVADITYRKTGHRVIRLDNDQIWQLVDVSDKGPLKEGDAIVVRKAALGSFMLVTPARVALRARRIH